MFCVRAYSQHTKDGAKAEKIKEHPEKRSENKRQTSKKVFVFSQFEWTLMDIDCKCHGSFWRLNKMVGKQSLIWVNSNVSYIAESGNGCRIWCAICDGRKSHSRTRRIVQTNCRGKRKNNREAKQCYWRLASQ